MLGRIDRLSRSAWVQRAMVVFAGVLYALALKYFVLPSRVILTGTEGVAAALSYYFESDWLFIGLYLVFQLSLLTFGFARVSRGFAARSLIVVVTVATLLSLLPEQQFAQPEPQNERIMLVIFGGLLAGVAKAVAFRNRGSTGDEDVLAAYFASKLLKPVGLLFVVAATFSTAFGLGLELLKTGAVEPVVNTLMYTCLYIFVSSETLNNLYHKFKLTMLAVFTDRAQEVGDAIRAETEHRTYTVQEGVGGHSKRTVQIVRTIVTNEELPGTIATVERADPECFYFHHDVEGVSGRYYIAPIG